MVSFITTIFIGIFCIFLNSSLSWAVPTSTSSTYLFDNEYCSNLSGVRWRPLGQRCPKDQILYSMKESLGLFCQYKLAPNEDLRAAIAKNRFYRSAKDTRAITYSQGESFISVPSSIEYLYFSKRDILKRDEALCTEPDAKNIAASAFVMHIPNSFYVIKSGLKKYNDPNALPVAQQTTQKPVETVEEKEEPRSDNFTSNKSIEVQPVLFYDTMKGTQISNNTTAEISSKLSPGLHARLTFRENKKVQYSILGGINFHVYTEKASQLNIANNNVQSLNVGGAVTLEHFRFFTPEITASVFEDLYYARQSSTSIGIERELVTRLKLSSKIYFLRNDTYNLSFSPNVFYDLEKGELESGIGYEAPLSFVINRGNYRWGATLNYTLLNKDLADLELEKSTAAFSFLMGFKF